MKYCTCRRKIVYFEVQHNFNGWNTDGPFTMAVSNPFMSLKEKNLAADIMIYGIIKGDFLFYSENDIVFVLNRIASMNSNENTQYTFILKKIKKINLFTS